jgi:DNA-directed RNA polymerase specialized sigma24 family protein
MGSMTTQLGKPTFDVAYEDWRPRLYRALVLATGDRDLALEAVDDAFSRERRAIGRTGGSPPAEALGAARRRLTRKRRDYSGFRLPDDQPGPETAAVVDAVRTLELDARLALIASRYLGWDDDTVGRALGMLPSEAAQRV